MSMNFRPVKETWYEGSSQFIEHDLVLAVFEHVALAISSEYSQDEYGELTAFWVGNGADFLHYILTDEDFNSLYVSNDLAITDAGLESLLSNMKNMAGSWKQALDTDNSLRFYVD